MRRLAPLLALVAVTACATGGGSVPAPLDPRVGEAFAALAPTSSNQVHKVSVRVGGRDLVLTGYLALHRDRGLRAVAVDEFGGKLLDMTSCDGVGAVTHAPPQLAAEILERGPLGDLELAYLHPVGLEVVASTPVTQAVAWERDGRRLSCEVDLAGARVRSCVERHGRRLVRELRFTYSGDSPAPVGFEVRHRRLHYRLRAEVLEVRPGGGDPPRWCSGQASAAGP